MARKKNPINDIVDTVGGWLGGRGPGTNPQVQAAMQATRAIARTADTATGGFGQALLSDAQRMAMTGSSTPSALYKTAAVNLGAAAAGVGAAKVAGKVLPAAAKSKIGQTLSRLSGKDVVGVHVSPVSGLPEIVPPSNAVRGSGMGPIPGKPVVPNVTYRVSTVGNRRRNISPSIVTNKAVGLGDTYYSQKGFSAYVTRSPIGKADPEQPLSGISRITGKQKVVAEVKFPKYSSVPEDFNEWGRLPKTKEGRELARQIRAAQQNVYKESFERVSGAVSRAAPIVGFGAGAATQKKKARGGGTKKR